MRRIVTSTALGFALLAGGSAAPAGATQLSTSTHAVTASAPRAASGAVKASDRQAEVQQSAQHDLGKRRLKRRLKRRSRTRTVYRDRHGRVVYKKRRSGLSRIFGVLGFLLCLPFLLVLVALVIFMMRRNRRRRDQEVYPPNDMNRYPR